MTGFKPILAWCLPAGHRERLGDATNEQERTVPDGETISLREAGSGVVAPS